MISRQGLAFNNRSQIPRGFISFEDSGRLLNAAGAAQGVALMSRKATQLTSHSPDSVAM